MSSVNLDSILLPIPEGWTVNHALQGTHIFGGTGSGKTTGSGQHIALNMLEVGMGGLVLTVKPDEVELWEKYCARAGKDPVEDMIIFGPKITEERPYSFNFLEYEKEQVSQTVERQFPDETEESKQSIAASFLTENIVNLFSAIMEVAQRGNSGGGNNDAYWLNSVRQLLRNALGLLIISGEDLTFQNLHSIIMSAPTSLDEADRLAITCESGEGSSSVFERCVYTFYTLDDNNPRIEDCLLIIRFWFKEFPALAPETRSITLSYFTGAADPFLRGSLKQLFSPEANSKQLDPELTRQGKVIIMALPVKEYFELGQFAQVLYKFIFQRSAERGAGIDENVNPVFLWADEAQFFINSHDMLFQTTARSSKVATVYLTQNISNYYAIMSGEKGKAETDSLLGNFVTKIFHSNTDGVTNIWSAEVISKTVQHRKSVSTSDNSSAPEMRSGKGSLLKNTLMGGRKRDSFGMNVTQNEVFDYQVPPVEFTSLKTGGKDNNLIVEAIFTQGGRLSSDGRNYQHLEIKQFYP